MKNVLCLFFLSFSTLTILVAQDVQYKKQIAGIQTIIEGYNEQNYAKMKRPWFFLGKILVTKKALMKEYEKYFNKYGNDQIGLLCHDRSITAGGPSGVGR